MEQCWFIPAADVTQVTTLCCFSRAGWCLEAFYWSLITQDPLTMRGPTCLPKTVHFILASSVRCVCPVGSQHVAPEPVKTDTLVCNWKWHCALGSNKRKVLKKWLFFPTFPSPRRGKSVSQTTVVIAACGKERCFSPFFCPPHASFYRILKRASKANKPRVGASPHSVLQFWSINTGEAKGVLPPPIYPLTAARSVYSVAQLFQADWNNQILRDRVFPFPPALL